MYIGMAIAYYWDEDWERYSHVPDLYKMMILNTDFDHLDDYIRQQVLRLTPEQGEKLQQTVGECAARTYNTISHLHVEPGTPDAFRVFIAATHHSSPNTQHRHNSSFNTLHSTIPCDTSFLSPQSSS